MTSPHGTKGFTLVELLITVAIMMIVMVLVVPSINDYVASSRVSTTRDLLNTSINQAQQEAIRQNLSSYICPSSNGTSCASNWSSSTGWIAYVDSDRSGGFSAGDEIIVSNASPKASVLLADASAAVSTRFFPSGHSSESSFLVCSDANTDYYELSVNRMGRTQYAVSSKSCN